MVPYCNTRDDVQDVPPATDLVSRLRDSGTECGSFHVRHSFIYSLFTWDKQNVEKIIYRTNV